MYTDNHELKNAVSRYISGKRYTHTLAVERECLKLSEIFKLSAAEAEGLSYAALLHDITKEKKLPEQLELCARFGLEYDTYDVLSPKVFHARTGAALAASEFPDIADEYVCSCIECHTTGKPNMTLPQKLLYLADYIEDTRTFDDCIELRRMFYAELPNTIEERLAHLNRILVISFDMTIYSLLEDRSVINMRTVETRNWLLKECKSVK